MTRLDRQRSFGTVSPPHQGAHFHQDGVYFDHTGHPVDIEGGAANKARPQGEGSGGGSAGGIAGDPDAVDFTTLSWNELQKAMTARGLKAKNKKEALRVLTEHEAANA